MAHKRDRDELNNREEPRRPRERRPRPEPDGEEKRRPPRRPAPSREERPPAQRRQKPRRKPEPQPQREAPETLDPQQRRAEARKKRLEEQRRLKRNLMVAGVVMLLCIAGIFAIAKFPEFFGLEALKPDLAATEPGQVPENTLVALPEKEPEKKPGSKPEKAESGKNKLQNPITTIHIKAAGDLNVTDSVVQSGLVGSGYDFTNAFIDVAAILSDADLTMLNFEGNVCGQPYGSETRSAPPELLTGLVNAGVDIVQTANSYSVFNGLIGLDATLQSIRNSGLIPLGSYSTPQEFAKNKGYLIADVQGIKVAMVAFTKGVGGMGMPAGNEECVNLLYEDYDDLYKKINKDGITKVLRAAQAEKPDIVIAMLHWGSEYNDTISDTQTQIVELMKKEGVDVIIGSHPHTVQWVDFDEKEGTLIAYSLGDFFGEATAAGTNYSIILDIEITKDANSGITKVTDFDYEPIYTLNDKTEREEISGLSRQVVRIRTAMQARDGNFVDRITAGAYGSMEYSLERIRDRVNGVDQDPEQIKAREDAEKEKKKQQREEKERQQKEQEKADRKANRK